MNYKDLSAGLKYFSELDENSDGDIIVPVSFPKHPVIAVQRQIYHRAFMERLFKQREKDEKDLANLKKKTIAPNGNIGDIVEREEDMMQQASALNDEMSWLTNKLNSLKLNQAQCPYTRQILDKQDMKPHLSVHLFRNIFIVAAQDSITKNKNEYYDEKGFPKEETKRLLEVFKTLSIEEINEAKKALQAMGENKPTIVEPNHVELLKKWSIQEGINNDLNVENGKTEKASLPKESKQEVEEDEEDEELTKAINMSLTKTPQLFSKDKEEQDLMEVLNQSLIEQILQEEQAEDNAFLHTLPQPMLPMYQTALQVTQKTLPTTELFEALSNKEEELALILIKSIENLDTSKSPIEDMNLIDFADACGCYQVLSYLHSLVNDNATRATL